jgi:dCTP deaminase
MSLLSDSEIASLLRADPPLLTNFPIPSDWDSKDSLVQPSSLDLHVGEIFVPPKEEPKVGDPVDKRTKEYMLQPGQTVVVDTLEELALPNNIAAFGFPPTSISNRAVLMTNPGHIDPGFKGSLSFTLINMGREQFVVTSGQPIVTLLLVRLTTPANKDFTQRNPSFKKQDHTIFSLQRLGRDFLDLDQRARNAAETVVRKENIRISSMQVWVPLLAALLGAVLAFVGAWIQSKQAIAELNQKITELQTQQKFQERLGSIEKKLDELNSSGNKQDQKANPKTK